jgi:hypothetical protein
MRDDWAEMGKNRRFNGGTQIFTRLLWLVVALLVLTSCGVQARVGLKTRVNSLGWGEHEMILAVPVEFYNGALFDRLPDFSLITGVQVEDYHAEGWQGMRVTQPFYRLGQLNGDPERAHFLNKAFPGQPVAFQAAWRQGFFTRDLQVRIFLNSARSNALAEAISFTSQALLDATFTLELPGKVIAHNGATLDERTVTWTLDPGMPQTLEATARVLDVPLILSAVFTLGSGGFALYVHTARANGIGRSGKPRRPERPGLRSSKKRSGHPVPPARRPPARR